MDLESLYFLGNANQTGMTLDGTGNYTGGSFVDVELGGFQTAVNAIGHQISNAAATDWMNASTFVRLHIDCPTSGGSPVSGSYGINLQQGDGNTFTGGDIEGCATALHLGANAQNNTIVGLRNENSTNQIVADAGSSYNSWMTGGTMFTGQLTDNGTRNSFLDTFHRSFNGLNGDWYGSQKDATLTNHYRLGIGTGNERGLLNEIQTDYGYRWVEGYSDATAGEQFYQIDDLLNNVNRLSIGQYNNGQSSTNNQTAINSAGTGAVVLNGSANAGTGGVVIGSGGANESTVATISGTGNAQFNGNLQVGGASTLAGSATVKNQGNAEIDYILQAGATASQKESLIYNDWNGNSQWYMVKDANNNWALNSATGGLDSFMAYQSTNSGDTYVNASKSTGVVRINYESGAGTGFKVYGGNSSTLYASFTGMTAIQFPGLAASSGHNCLQVDNSGYITNTGTACGTGSSNGTINAGTSGQIAFYNGSGTALSGTSTVSVSAGGTGSSTASGALGNLGGAAITGAAFTGPVSTSSTLSAKNMASIGARYDVTQFGAVGNGVTDDTAAIQAAFNACYNGGVAPYGGVVEFPGPHSYVVSSTINAYDSCQIEGVMGNSSVGNGPVRMLWNGAAVGTVSTITAFSVTSGMATFTAANTLTAGQWVDIEGLTTALGVQLNRNIAQVSATGLSSTQFEIPVNNGNISTTSDSGTATTVNVMLALDGNARYEQSISNMQFALASGAGSNSLQVDVYFGSRVDTGTHVLNTWAQQATEYGYYFSGGGINVDFDKGWRCDGVGIGCIYWRVAGADSFGIANGTVDNYNGGSTSGGAVVLDNSTCANQTGIHFTSRNFKVEVNTSLASGLGVFTMYDCPSNTSMEAFYLDLENTWVTSASNAAGFNYPSIAMSPANDAALSLTLVNDEFPVGSGSNTTARWVGLPTLSRNDMGNGSPVIPFLSYAPSGNSSGGYWGYNAPDQLIGDANISQLWQYGVKSSAFLFSDTAFAALPNATTLYAGQILAPPAYWNGANGSRYALDVVYQTGTTGRPNSGNTTCTGTSGTAVLTCTSATDLSAGQHITIGTDTNKAVSFVDATESNAVLVHLASNLAANYSTATALSFSAPALGPEIQMSTKSPAAPTTLAWSQGDIQQNSGAVANGICGWVNVAGGTPGTWTAIPCANSSGQITAAQIAPASLQGTDSKVLTAGTVSGTGATLCTDSNGGATTSGCSGGGGSVATNAPLWLQYLGTGADGSYEATAASCTSAAPCLLTGEKYYTSFTIDSGAYAYVNVAYSSSDLVVHATGACNIYGTILANWTKNGWPNTNKGVGGGSSGGSGGGTSAGSGGVTTYPLEIPSGSGFVTGGSGGAAGGGNGASGSSLASQVIRATANSGADGLDGLYLTGSTGVTGGSSGGTGGEGGSGLVMMCGSINGTGGVIDASGGPGNPSAANSTGAGSGGGGGVVILSSQATVTNWPAVYVSGGPGGLVTVPEAVATSGTCTTRPKATLGVSSGALSGSCTVAQAGVGCGTGAGVVWNVLGGGGTAGTAVINPTWSSGALASCTVTPGTSSGYTAATYTTAGTGGDGGNGWYAEFAGW